MRFRFERLLNTWIQLTDLVDMDNSFHNLGPWWNVLDMFLLCLCSTCGLWLCCILCPWISVFCVNKVIRGGESSLCTKLYINVPSWNLEICWSFNMFSFFNNGLACSLYFLLHMFLIHLFELISSLRSQHRDAELHNIVP